MQNNTILSIICLCHNHVEYLDECLESILKVCNSEIEIILVDDGSSDGSKEKLQHYATLNNWFFLSIPQPVGNCSAFNKALPKTRGIFTLDLATDDVLIPDSFNKYLTFCLSDTQNIGFYHANALYIDYKGKILKKHFKHSTAQTLASQSPDFIFAKLFEKSFICPSTVIFNTSILKKLNGYDPNLSFEDFDIWMRIARNWKVNFFNEVVIKKRLLKNSCSYHQTRKNKISYLNSILIISDKAISLAQNNDELIAVSKFISYHYRLSYYLGLKTYVIKFFEKIRLIRNLNFLENTIRILSTLNFFPTLAYNVYQKLLWFKRTKTF
jgi:glycosyltransferase involved in cell wall biosynthesis